MTKLKKLGLSLSVVMLGLLAMEVGGRLSVPGVSGYVATAEARCGTPSDTRQRRRRRAQDDAPLRGRRL